MRARRRLKKSRRGKWMRRQGRRMRRSTHAFTYTLMRITLPSHFLSHSVSFSLICSPLFVVCGQSLLFPPLVECLHMRARIFCSDHFSLLFFASLSVLLLFSQTDAKSTVYRQTAQGVSKRKEKVLEKLRQCQQDKQEVEGQ